MLNIKIELLKIKGTVLLKLLLIAPVIICLFSLLTNASFFTSNTYNWMSIIFIHLICSLVSSFIVNHEDKSTQFYFIENRNEKAQRGIWTSKMKIVLLYILGLLFIQWIITSITFNFLKLEQYSILSLLLSSLTIWVTSVWEIPLNFILLKKFSVITTLIINFLVGTVLGIFLAESTIGMFLPWSWAARSILIILKIKPNGEILRETLTKVNPFNIIYLFMVSIVLYVVLREIFLKMAIRRK